MEGSGLIARIVPSLVAVVEAYEDAASVELFDEEELAVANAVESRYREFATVRSCARQAMAELGLPPVAVVPGEGRAPRWPAGVVGSMTHCVGYRAAALSMSANALTIGIDAEPHEPLPAGLLPIVARPEEITALAELGRAMPQICWSRLLFSAKESVYKAWFPLTKRWLDFHEASVRLGPDGSFTARLLTRDPPFEELAGRWRVASGLVGTAIVAPRETTRTIMSQESAWTSM